MCRGRCRRCPRRRGTPMRMTDRPSRSHTHIARCRPSGRSTCRALRTAGRRRRGRLWCSSAPTSRSRTPRTRPPSSTPGRRRRGTRRAPSRRCRCCSGRRGCTVGLQRTGTASRRPRQRGPRRSSRCRCPVGHRRTRRRHGTGCRAGPQADRPTCTQARSSPRGSRRTRQPSTPSPGRGRTRTHRCWSARHGTRRGRGRSAGPPAGCRPRPTAAAGHAGRRRRAARGSGPGTRSGSSRPRSLCGTVSTPRPQRSRC